MMPLFKYVSCRAAIRLLESGMIRFTQASEFNDPFEMQPFLQGLADETTLEEQFFENFGKKLGPKIAEMTAKLPPEQRARLNSGIVETLVAQQKPEALKLFKGWAGTITPALNKHIYRTVDDVLGVLCLTEDPADLLMWAHYSNDHKGVVIEFDPNNAFFNQRVGPDDDFRHFRPVRYTEERPAVFLSNSDPVDFFYFKSIEWKYEREWRLILPLASCSDRIDQSPLKPIYLYRVPPECIRSVTVGCRISPADSLELAKAARSQLQYSHISFQRMELNGRYFKLDSVPISPSDIDALLAKARALSAR